MTEPSKTTTGQPPVPLNSEQFAVLEGHLRAIRSSLGGLSLVAFLGLLLAVVAVAAAVDVL